MQKRFGENKGNIRSTCRVVLQKLNHTKFFQLTYPLSGTKNEKKLLLHKATMLMMISFSTFSPPLELENRSPGRSIQVFPTDHPSQKASAPTCHAVITFPSSPKQPTEEGYL